MRTFRISEARSSGDDEGELDAEDEDECWNCDVVTSAKRFERWSLPVSGNRGRLCCEGWMIATRSFDSGAAGRLQRSPEHILVVLYLRYEDGLCTGMDVVERVLEIVLACCKVCIRGSW